MRIIARSLNERGVKLHEQGRLAEAEKMYLRAAKADPRWAIPWYNAGLMCKLQLKWPESARYNQRSTELDPEDRDAWWNLGIAATALGDWALARDAWRRCGIDVPDGDGPPRMTTLGPVPVRLSAGDHREVVWCDRIDPARAVICNVPLPGSGFAEGDTVLHDGAVNGYRVVNGHKVPVFDMLQLLERSGRLTLEAWVVAPAEDDVEALQQAGDDAGVAVEDWSHTIRHLCEQCSEGIPHAEHDPPPAGWSPRRRLGIAAASADEARRLLEAWARGAADRRVLDGIPGTSPDN